MSNCINPSPPAPPPHWSQYDLEIWTMRDLNSQTFWPFMAFAYSTKMLQNLKKKIFSFLICFAVWQLLRTLQVHSAFCSESWQPQPIFQPSTFLKVFTTRSVAVSIMQLTCGCCTWCRADNLSNPLALLQKIPSSLGCGRDHWLPS